MKIECTNCWKEKQKRGGDCFDVVTEHTFVEEYEHECGKTEIWKCDVCGSENEVDVI